ncbi:MAG: methyl-accepting chemotaxis protein, partial [Pseudomonadota bacterium]
MRNLTVVERLVLVALVPILALIYFCGSAAWTNWQSAKSTDALLSDMEFAQAASDLVHDLQVERGSSVGFLSSGGSDRFKAVVNERRALVDGHLQQFANKMENVRHQVGSEESAMLEKIEAQISGLPQIRSGVDGLSVSAKEAVGTYTSLINNLISSIGLLAKEMSGETLAGKLGVYRDLVLAKEMAGLVRANGAALFNSDTLDPGRYRTFVSLAAREQAYLREFQLFADDQTRNSFAARLNGSFTEELETWQAILLALPETNNDTQGIEGADWFALATERIDQLKAVENAIAANLKSQARENIDGAYSQAFGAAIVGGIVIAFVIVITYYLARSISGPIAKLARQIMQIAEGSTDVEVDAKQSKRTEIGKMNHAASVFLKMTFERRRIEQERKRAEKAGLELRQQTLNAMAEEVKTATDEGMNAIVESASGLNGTTDQMRALLSEASSVVENATEQAADSSQAADEVSTLASKMVHAIAEVSEQCGRTNTLSEMAVEQSNTSRQAVEELAEAAASIDGFVNMISEIAEQTNLLALNAT